MVMHAGTFKPSPRKKRERVGRGSGSGLGKTCSRGGKGQTARAGGRISLYFEGGQMPLYRRLPLRGFNNSRYQKEFQIVNVKEMDKLNLKEVNPSALFEKGLIGKKDGLVKILGDGEIKTPMTIQAHQFSKTAEKKIIESGGKALVIGKQSENEKKKPDNKPGKE
ncbi:MAG: 50S ribosomal protein L15 [Candidatus Aureabacteria bacterium]|nr:50S ribosomal protein L15 [Candidatus Auribacterota bacterium]